MNHQDLIKDFSLLWTLIIYIYKRMVPHKHIKKIKSMIHSRLFTFKIFFGEIICIDFF